MTSSSPGAARSIQLLGPVQVGGADVAGHATLAPRERALMARLALDVNRAVTTDRLVDDLWDGGPTSTARNALQVYVSHLRARLGRSIISSVGGGYRLDLEPSLVDSIEFERLVAVALGQMSSGRAYDAVGALDAAAELWRGDPLADLSDYAFARVEAARLGELRAASIEHLAEALLMTGSLERLTDELGPLVRSFPFRDRLRAAVMTGLYRQGRAVDALAMYAEVVDLLREELGLDPGPALKALQRAILTDDPALVGTLPSGELTLLASAVENPTALLTRLGERYGEALLAQRALLRESFTAYGGLELPMGGERFFAVFPHADDAVAAAAAAQRSLAVHAFADEATVRVRIGIHTGSPRVVGQHYVGMDVHRATQVADAAAGGQVLVTGDTARLLDRGPPRGGRPGADGPRPSPAGGHPAASSTCTS